MQFSDMCNHYLQERHALKYGAARVQGLRLPDTVPEVPEHTWPKYIAPVILQEEGQRVASFLRWGVWPYYARDKPQFITNARDDGLLTKATWKQSVAKRRCLIPAAAYFEPGTGPVGARGELRFSLKERPCFFFAGLWDTDPDGSRSRGFAMVTTRPNDYVTPYHDRMPVVLDDTEALDWLGSEPLSPDHITHLTRPLPNDALQHEAIAPLVRGKKITREDIQSGEFSLG